MKKSKKRVKKETCDWLKSFIWAIVIALVVRIFFVGNFKIPTSSMVPTLQVGDRLLSNSVVYRFRAPRRGEVVIFKYPEDPARDFVKRLVGLPGEALMIREGEIYIDGEAVENRRINSRYYYSDGVYGIGRQVEIPQGGYYVLGDNSINSKDSRYWGFVPENYMGGKAVFIYWPPWRMGFIR